MPGTAGCRVNPATRHRLPPPAQTAYRRRCFLTCRGMRLPLPLAEPMRHDHAGGADGELHAVTVQVDGKGPQTLALWRGGAAALRRGPGGPFSGVRARPAGWPRP